MMKTKAVHLTEQGADKAERMFKIDNLYDVQNVDIISHINTALRAHVTLQRDVDYMVVDGEVLIVINSLVVQCRDVVFLKDCIKLLKLKKA